jgi:hypothetical protein
MGIFNRDKGQTAAVNLLQSHGATPAQSKVIASAMDKARKEGLRGRQARQRAIEICQADNPRIDWQSIFSKIGPILELVMKILAMFAVVLLLFCVTTSTADAQCRGRCPAVAAVEAPIATPMPDQSRSVPAAQVLVQAQPVRNAVKVTAWEGRRVLRATGRVAAAPFRWLRGGCCR